MNLVCFPHAGGAASFYRGWGENLSPDIEVHVLQYPGREDRLTEPCIDDMEKLADVVTEVVLQLFGRPLVLFGHSMGASLMYEVARRCESVGRFPELLIASGHPAPHRRKRTAVHLEGDDALVAELQRFSVRSATILDNPELREIMLPMIRADYQLIETYRLEVPEPVRTPLAVFRGIDDPDVDADQATDWRDLTLSGELVEHRVFKGGHFYVQEHQNDLLKAIDALIASM